ncbi:WEB family protein At5g55860-like [Cynara cardunculus var. scolymus]|uniref:WEB family protein At5g55860-like n=1 Tax=Cynara cardunculus var. scolymus TaxID=59895 RepID=UPI000D62F116|nr:WEB family protein At5g55860-like [Cynara cardunculus var. scolymus]XP_024960331.1 WEB family protein At5g55860-like [Cynara cardunculus var. scolymus]XP_024960332.1 WEB family protein At5g55860-like [Cynara cardunculus var. scolymus]
MVAKDRQNKTDSPKVEVGEIDTRAPFQSVKDAVNLFGEGAFSGEKLTIKKITKPQSAERVLVKETKLHLAQKELDKLKERLKIAETTKTGALTELERAKRTVEDLTNKLQVINAAKEMAIKATEAAKDQAKQLDGGQTNTNGFLTQDLENTKEQYAAVFTELDAAKQELRRIRHDREAAMEEKSAAIGLVTEAEVTSKASLDRAGEISKEIMSVQEAIEQVKRATVEAQKEQEKIYAEKNVQKLAHKAALEESAKKLLALRKEIDPEMSKDLETQFAETTSEIKRLQTEMENARASDLDSLKNVTSELDGAKESLQKVVEEEGSLKSLLESLKIELENVKKEHEELKAKEAETETVAGDLNVKLQKSKVELEAACLEEAKVSGASEEMMATLRQLTLESENAKRESEEMKSEAEELKKEAAAMGAALEEAENKLRIALQEADEAKSAESKALEEIKLISERTDAARASTSESGSKITISREEFESLSRKVEESEKLAGMKVEAAMAQAEAVKASEKEAVKKLEATQKEIDEMKAATEAALKRAEMADAARKAVEGELRRWREREQKKAEEAASLILQETQMQTPLSLPSTPIHKQQIPAQKPKPKTKKVLVSNLSGMFQRKKSQVDGGGSSPSYLPGEKPM